MTERDYRHKTETTDVKFVVKEGGPDDPPFLAMEFLGGLPEDVLLLNEAHLFLNFRHNVSYDEAVSIAGELNDRIKSLSIMTGGG